MKRLILALALVACAAPLYAHAGGRCAERRAERKAKRSGSTPVRVVPAVSRAVVTVPAKLFRFVTGRETCNGANCPN